MCADHLARFVSLKRKERDISLQLLHRRLRIKEISIDFLYDLQVLANYCLAENPGIVDVVCGYNMLSTKLCAVPSLLVLL